MKTDIELDHLFRVSFLSSKHDGSWVMRHHAAAPTTKAPDPYSTACGVAVKNMRVTETGVRVEYLGLQESGKRDAPITEMNPFTVEIVRKGYLSRTTEPPTIDVTPELITTNADKH